MSVTTISQSGNLASLIPVQIFGNYLIEGNGVTVTTSTQVDVSAFTNFTVASGANFQLGSGLVLGLFDTFTIATGGTLDIQTNISALGDVSFAGNGGSELVLATGVGTSLLTSVSGFAGGDSIDFQGVGAPLSGTSVSEIFTGTDTDFSVTLASGLLETFALTGDLVGQPVSLAPDSAGGFVITDTACFAAGTAILTTRGEVPVEHLTTGDIAVLADGATAPITFIGRRHLDIARHPRPEAIRPVRILPGALGHGIPARQLTLSPDHALFIDGVLVQAKDLIDNATILQDSTVTEIDYFHVELPAHGILLAEGTPAESFLDTGNRGMFENGGQLIMLHPDLMQMRREAESIAPLCPPGETLTTIRARLRARGKHLGLAAVETLALTARANHHPISPVANTREQVIFALPPGTDQLLIATPTFTPADFDPASSDRRQLGLAVTAISVDHQRFTPEDLAISGLHPRGLADTHAWTTGQLRLTVPVPARRVELHLAGRPQSWRFNENAA